MRPSDISALIGILAAGRDGRRVGKRHIQLLVYVGSRRQPRSMGTAAAELDWRTSGMSRIAGDMITAGLLSRRSAAGDRRVQLLELTRRGTLLLGRIEQFLAKQPGAAGPEPRAPDPS